MGAHYVLCTDLGLGGSCDLTDFEVFLCVCAGLSF